MEWYHKVLILLFGVIAVVLPLATGVYILMRMENVWLGIGLFIFWMLMFFIIVRSMGERY